LVIPLLRRVVVLTSNPPTGLDLLPLVVEKISGTGLAATHLGSGG